MNVSNPYAAAFPNVYNVNDLQSNVLSADFVAFEYGNVVGNGRSGYGLNVDDVELEAGQTTTVEIAAGELVGFQGTFEFGRLQLLGATYTGEGAVNLERTADGLLTASLYGEDAALTLEVRAGESLRLSEELRLTDGVTVAEGVGTTGSGGLALLFETSLAPASAQNELYQNVPNPFAEQTLINFDLAQPGSVTLTVADLRGRIILNRAWEGVAGANRITLRSSDLGGNAGVLTYTIKSGDFSATRRMIVVAD